MHIFVCVDTIKKVEKRFLRFFYYIKIIYVIYHITGHFKTDISHSELINLFEFDSFEKGLKMAHLHFLLTTDDAF